MNSVRGDSQGGSGSGRGDLSIRVEQSCLAGASAGSRQERWAVERQLQRFVEVVGHPETGTTGGATLRRDWFPGGGTKFGHRPTMLGDLENLTISHDLRHDGAELGLGLKYSNSPHKNKLV